MSARAKPQISCLISSGSSLKRSKDVAGMDTTSSELIFRREVFPFLLFLLFLVVVTSVYDICCVGGRGGKSTL